MTPKDSFVAYIQLPTRKTLSHGGLKTAAGTKAQLSQIATFIRGTGSALAGAVFDQTTSHKTRFWLRPKFRLAVQHAHSVTGRVVVADVVVLLQGLNSANVKDAWSTIWSEFSKLTSARHLEAIQSGIHIKTDLEAVLAKKAVRIKRNTGKTRTVAASITQNSGARGTRIRGDEMAKALAPELKAILRKQPDAGSTYVADVLNEKDIKSPSGGKWHPSSASNLVKRCRKLGIIKL